MSDREAHLAALTAAIRPQVSRGAYQMPGDVLPYDTFAAGIAASMLPVIEEISAADVRTIEGLAAERDRFAEGYEMVRDAVIEAFNPEDDDASEPGIMVGAIVAARAFIETRPCECPEDGDEDNDEPCARCMVLGRFLNEAVER